MASLAPSQTGTAVQDGGSLAQAGGAAKSPTAYVYMDAMRAACAAGVALSHIWNLLIGDYVPTRNLLVQILYFAAGFGHAGVVLFFVLSGYWITRSVATRSGDGRWSWAGYIVDRLARLLVVVLPVLLIGGVLDHVSAVWLHSTTLHQQTGSYMVPVPYERSVAPTTLLGNLVFLQGLAVPPFGSNGPLWSLAYEFWFYIWFPALWLLLRYRMPSVPLLALGLGVLFPGLALGFVTWSCGSLLYFAERYARQRPALWKSLATRAPVPAAVTFGVALFWLRAAGFFWLDDVVALSFAILLLALIAADLPVFRAVEPLARYGARASFSLYAIHFPIVVFVATVTVDHVRPQPGLVSVTLAYAVLFGCAVLAWYFAQATEARTSAIRRRLGRIFGVRTERA